MHKLIGKGVMSDEMLCKKYGCGDLVLRRRGYALPNSANGRACLYPIGAYFVLGRGSFYKIGVFL